MEGKRLSTHFFLCPIDGAGLATRPDPLIVMTERRSESGPDGMGGEGMTPATVVIEDEPGVANVAVLARLCCQWDDGPELGEYVATV